MAEKKSVGNTFEEIMRDLKAGQFAPVYVLMGGDPIILIGSPTI
jgi:hypothetical protein